MQKPKLSYSTGMSRPKSLFLRWLIVVSIGVGLLWVLMKVFKPHYAVERVFHRADKLYSVVVYRNTLDGLAGPPGGGSDASGAIALRNADGRTMEWRAVEMASAITGVSWPEGKCVVDGTIVWRLPKPGQLND